MKNLRHTVTASQLERVMACPGSVRLSVDIPQTRSAAALDGNFAHALGEHMIKKKPVRPGHIIELRDGEKMKADDKMMEAARFYADHVLSYGGRVFTEVSVKHDGHTRNAYADTIIDMGREIVVIDFKYGYFPVRLVNDAGEVNPQLLYYAYGALELHRWKHKYAVLEIVQPRCQEVPPIQSHRVLAGEVKKWGDEILFERLHAIDDPAAPLNPGGHCHFCPALAACPAVQAESNKLAMTDFGELSSARSGFAISRLSPIIPDDPERLSRVLKFAPVVDAWLRACEAAAQAELEAGREVPGFKLVAKRSNRKWPDGKSNIQVVKALGVPMGRAKNCYTEPELLSPAQMEKVLGKETVNQVAVKPDAGVTIAAESDRREAVGPTRDFEELL